jgi:hypothetical protein
VAPRLAVDVQTRQRSAHLAWVEVAVERLAALAALAEVERLAVPMSVAAALAMAAPDP